jgi:cyclopropane fatty-acyl-phospholipid synthase-like methyltransferase
MSIFTGKDGYNSKAVWRQRTETALRERGPLYEYDLGLEDQSACIGWIKSFLSSHPLTHVLEVGSGFGKWAKVLANHYLTYTGLEVIPARVQHATALYGSKAVRFENLSDEQYCGKYDVVLSVTVLQHVTVPEAVELLRIIARHLTPTGSALLAEWRIWDITVEEAERRYADPKCSAHMIPKPLSYLQAAVPELVWHGEPGQFVIRKAA